MTAIISSNKSKCLSGDEIKYIHVNYERKTYKQIAEELGTTEATVWNHVKKAGLKKRQFSHEYNIEKIKSFIKPYSGKVTITELHGIYSKKEDISIHNFRRILKRMGFVSFVGRFKTRLYLDGCPENLTPENLILIPHRYRNHFRDGRFGGLTGDALITALKLIEYQEKVDAFEIGYVATNLKTGEKIENESVSKLAKEIGFERNAYWKRKTIGKNGGKVIGNWEIIKKVKRGSREI